MKKISNHLTAFAALALTTLAFATTNVEAQKKKNTGKTMANVPVKEQQQEEIAPTLAVEPIAAPKSSRMKICVGAPKTNLTPSDTASESLRNSLLKYLSGPAAEIVPLDALVAVQQRAEAVEKGCAFYLSMSVQQKKSGGGEGFGALLKKSANAAPILTDIGAGKTAQTVSRVAVKSQTKLTTAGDLAVGIKAKDEITLEYNLFVASSNANAASGKIKTKASKDGEDVLSNLLEQSVNAVLTAALKK